MSRSRLRVLVAVAFLALFVAARVSAQEAEKPATQKAESAQAATEQEAGDANAGVAEILAKTTEQSAHSAEKWGDKLGLSHKTSFAISIALNFLGIAAFIYMLLKANLPKAFRERTASIQKSIKEAQAASADANRRLGDIESRLSKLDAEVADIRQTAERDAAAEEQRIRQAAEHDKQRIVEGAEAEIEAMARNARRELKSYAASLAVDLAARKIQVDERTDHVLVREFIDQLGKDGQ